MVPIMTQSTAIMAALAGGAIGVMFFGGQWLTCWLAQNQPNYRFWQRVSWVLCSGLALIGFYWVAAYSVLLIIFSLIGFIVGYGVVRVLCNMPPPLEPGPVKQARVPARPAQRPMPASEALPPLLRPRPGRVTQAEEQVHQELQPQSMQQDRRKRNERRAQNERRNQADRRLQANRRGFPDRRGRPNRREHSERRGMVHG